MDERKAAWEYWRGKGYDENAVASIVGNIGPESAFRANNVEDRCPLSDADYTARVDDGRISRDGFIKDRYGYGLYQHTYWSRKAGLYDLAKKRGVSIADPTVQHDWAETELHQPEYWRVLNVLKSDAGIYEKTRAFMLWFERPADQSEAAISYRVSCAMEAYKEFAGTQQSIPAQNMALWPPRVVDKTMSGSDVLVLQSILLARGYDVVASGTFDDATEQAVQKFQRLNCLDVDGVVGPMTWGTLLEVKRK